MKAILLIESLFKEETADVITGHRVKFTGHRVSKFNVMLDKVTSSLPPFLSCVKMQC